MCQLLSLDNPATEGKLSELLALAASKPDPQTKLFWRFPTSLPDTLYTMTYNSEKKDLPLEPRLSCVNSSTESLEPTRPKAARTSTTISQNDAQVLAHKFGQLRRQEQGTEGELPHFRVVAANDQLDPTNLKDAGVKLITNLPPRNTPCVASSQFRLKANHVRP